jgi:hypothetical protein
VTQYPELFAALVTPFSPNEVKQKNAGGGRQADYVTARTVANRLDMVLGPENWWDNYRPIENGVVCSLSVRLPDGSVVTKEDAGGNAGMADQGDDEKSGFSDAFKRAAVKFGPGRHLYRDGIPSYGVEVKTTPSVQHQEARDDRPGVDRRPPDRSVDRDAPRGPGTSAVNPSSGGGKPFNSPPRTGGAMFAWSKKQEEEYGFGVTKYLDNWAKLMEFPYKWKEWDSDQVAQAYAEAVRKIRSQVPGAFAEAQPEAKPAADSDAMHRAHPVVTPSPASGINSSPPTDEEEDIPFDRAPAPAVAVAGASSAVVSDTIQTLRGLLTQRAMMIVTLRKSGSGPKGGVTGKDIAQVLSSLHQLAPDVRLIHTVTACEDEAVLGRYLTEADQMIGRLRETAGPTLGGMAELDPVRPKAQTLKFGD